ncbi:MAG: squalene synthase HpnC [Solirubrobacteraceae bacterium]
MPEDATTQADAQSVIPDAAAVMARAAGENFPVAPRWLPLPQREHLLAIYGFARLTDELGDAAPGDRLAALDWLESELGAAYRGQAEHPLMRSLGETIAACALPRDPFVRLIAANRTDQRVRSYERWSDLMDYCALSANPVGELVLRVFDLATPERISQSDAVCSALQVIEHCQDIREDLACGRVYLPLEDLARYGANLDDIEATSASPALRSVLRLEGTRAAALLEAGGPLVRSLRGWPRVAVAGYVGGGRAALSALARSDFEVLATTPRPSPRRRAGSILRALGGSGG